jgi:hypothetical protein
MVIWSLVCPVSGGWWSWRLVGGTVRWSVVARCWPVSTDRAARGAGGGGGTSKQFVAPAAVPSLQQCTTSASPYVGETGEQV